MSDFLDVIKDSIVPGIIATTIFEIIKFIMTNVMSWVQEKQQPFSINGYWYSTVKEVQDNDEYFAGELMKLTYKNGKVLMKLYQITNDGRMYIYKGIGCLRNNKLALSYYECQNHNSRFVGNFILKIVNEVEHETILYGNYIEFRKEKQMANVFPYKAYRMKLSLKDKINFRLKGSNFFKELLEEES